MKWVWEGRVVWLKRVAMRHRIGSGRHWEGVGVVLVASLWEFRVGLQRVEKKKIQQRTGENRASGRTWRIGLDQRTCGQWQKLVKLRAVETRRSPAGANFFHRQSVRFVDHLPPLQMRHARILYTPARPLKITPQPRRQVHRSTAPFYLSFKMVYRSYVATFAG